MSVLVEDLTVRLGGRALVDGVGFTLAPGEVVALVGASGSGKTTTGAALLGEHPAGAEVSGLVRVAGHDVGPGSPPPPGVVGLVPQHPSAVLNPVRRVGAVLREIATMHGAGRDPDALVTDALRRARLPVDRDLLRRFPHQLSGGQQQRVVLAHALVCDPAVLVADEPTTGQDAVTRREVVAEFAAVARQGVAVVLLSHDLDVVRALADHVVVLRAGRVVEAGPVEQVAGAPRHDHTRALFAAADPAPRDPPPRAPARLEVSGLGARHGRVEVLGGVSLRIGAGECLAVVGRSGSGKTTLARCVAGLHAPDAGSVRLDGAALAGPMRRRTRAQVAAVQYVFQDARASFDPYRGVLDQVHRTGVRLRGMSKADATDAAVAAFAEVGLPEDTARRRPDALSGGELRRAALARALLADPRVLVCDEITAGLDALSQAAVLDLLERLRADRALLVVSHDLAVVARLADRVAVVDGGRVVEQGGAAAVLADPGHPATRRLLSTVTRDSAGIA